MLKRLALVSNVFLVVTVADFQYAHTNVGTEVSLKVVIGGVRHRAQKRGQSKYLLQTCGLATQQTCNDIHLLGAV